MAYTFKHAISSPVASPLALTSTGDLFVSAQAFEVKATRLGFMLTTAVVSSAPVIVSFYVRPTHGNTGTQVLIGTLSIPASGSVIGQEYYKDIPDSQTLNPATQAGQELVVNCSTAATGGGAAGAGVALVVVDESPEVALNQVNLVLSS